MSENYPRQEEGEHWWGCWCGEGEKLAISRLSGDPDEEALRHMSTSELTTAIHLCLPEHSAMVKAWDWWNPDFDDNQDEDVETPSLDKFSTDRGRDFIAEVEVCHSDFVATDDGGWARVTHGRGCSLRSALAALYCALRDLAYADPREASEKGSVIEDETSPHTEAGA